MCVEALRHFGDYIPYIYMYERNFIIFKKEEYCEGENFSAGSRN